MAFHTVEDGPWPVGTTVAVYATAAVVGGVPTGEPIDTGVAHADGVVSFGGLTEGSSYTAFGHGGSQVFEATNQEALGARVSVVEEAPVNVRRFGAKGDNSTQDRAAIHAARDYIGDRGGRIYLPYGRYRSDDGTIDLQSGQTLLGDGGLDVYPTEGVRAPTTIESSFNGPVVRVAASATGRSAGIADLMLAGDITKASQDLLEVGNADGVTPTAYFHFRNVQLETAGRDGVVLHGVVLESHLDHVYARGSGRYGLHADGNLVNAIKYTQCLFRESVQWGVYIQGGHHHFDSTVIESNSRHPTLSYGGLLLGSTGQEIQVKLTQGYFENNQGVAGGGAPWKMDAAGGGYLYEMVDDGSYYAEANSCVQNDGSHTAIVPKTNIATHIAVGAGADGTLVINPKKYGGGSFVVGGALTNVTILDTRNLEFRFNDRTLHREASSGYLRSDYFWPTAGLRLPTYTTATRPTPTGIAGNLIYVDDAAAGSRLQYSNGSAWVAAG